jgi:hypothetical protein
VEPKQPLKKVEPKQPLKKVEPNLKIIFATLFAQLFLKVA